VIEIESVDSDILLDTSIQAITVALEAYEVRPRIMYINSPA
jgi:hypothetical protein